MLQCERGAADTCPVETDVDLNAVCDLDERNAAVHSVVLAVEGHSSLDIACACSYAGDGERKGLGFRDAADGEGARYVEGVWAGLNNFC